jgi:FdhD protein
LRFDRAGNAIDDHANRMPRRPFLSNATIALTETIEALDERGRRSTVSIPAERPLTIYLDKRELVTLTTRGRVDNIDERGAESAAPGEGRGSAFAALMEEVEAISLSRTARLRQSTLYGIIDAVRAQRSVYKQAGSLHACALFSVQGEMLYFMEDVGRHNAVDAIAGRMWLDDVSGDDKVFYTTGRLTSEMVIKGGQMGIPFLLSRSGTTRMGHAVAQRLGISMFARCSGTHFLLLSGRERLILDLQLPDALAE